MASCIVDELPDRAAYSIMNPISSEDTTQPFLPPELERTIFEEAALSCFGHIPTLMLTAWRVKHWVEPFWYRVVFTSTRRRTYDPNLRSYVPIETLLQKLNGQSSVDIAPAVRHFFWDHDPQALKTTLIACTGITDLYIMGLVESDILSRLEGLPKFATPHHGYRFYTRLTHLELLACELDDSSEITANLDVLPNLTHIALNLYDPSDAGVIHDRIRRYSSLQCIIFLEPAHHIREAPDDRFVVLRQTNYAEDWPRGAIIGKDHWWLAEQFLAAKRAGEVDRLCYRIKDNDGISWECNNTDRQ
ncbi:hypothetical protein R3P38DRAFT_3376533 [Favolaschia claudopus]|uniref:Uncharacterized protein n=1 Tax=Favolaschia claudopus TaxID=2862362 RepID=A0AAV9ZF93_9AGAR